MKNIGVVLPYEKRSKSVIAEFFKKFRYQIVPIPEYNFRFVVADDRQNCARIFNRNNVESIVILTDSEIESCDFKIINGDIIYKRMLPEFLRKLLKSKGENSSVTIVDKNLSIDATVLTDRLCSMCHCINVATEAMEKAEIFCEDMMENQGIAINILDKKETIDSDVAVVLNECENNYANNCIVIDKNKTWLQSNGVINDFYIPFKTKPPFGMSNLVFAECIDTINIKNVDIS